jgi:ribose transport system permease protein
MTAISAAVIGGVSLAGGKGDVAGGIFGCLFFALLTNLIVSLRVTAFAQDMLKALILLAGVLIAVAIEIWGQKSKRVLG